MKSRIGSLEASLFLLGLCACDSIALASAIAHLHWQYCQRSEVSIPTVV
jgi:hypothetical protein